MAASRDASSIVVGAPGRSRSRDASRVKLLIAGLIILAVLGVLCASLLREAMTAGRTAGGAVARPSLAPPRPALTSAEEAYAQALWTIHGDVKNAAYNLTFSGLRYKLKQADGPEFETRVRAASKSLDQAEARTLSLVPPPSLRQVHAQYLDAVHLFQRSATEMLKVTADGRDDHLLAAHPLSQEASEKLLRVGNTIWPGEYLPN
jgi:hypothetical protein